MSVLKDFLAISGFQSQLFLTPKYKAPWGVYQKDFHGIMFHYVVNGTCYVGSGKPRLKFEQMFPGDFVIFPSSEDHALADSPERKLIDATKLLRPQNMSEMEHMVVGGNGAQTDIICGSFSFSEPGYEVIRALLPRMILIRRHDSHGESWVGEILSAMTIEYFKATSKNPLLNRAPI